MNAQAITDNYHSEYISLLNTLNVDKNALELFKLSILNSQNKIYFNEHIENNICQYCSIPWRYGNFILKTVTIKQNKNNINLQKTSFKLIMKCLMCLNENSMTFKKKKLPKNKCTKILSKTSKLINELPKVSEEISKGIQKIKEKHKKKKRNQYAGLNPLVFKKNKILIKN